MPDTDASTIHAAARDGAVHENVKFLTRAAAMNRSAPLPRPSPPMGEREKSKRLMGSLHDSTKAHGDHELGRPLSPALSPDEGEGEERASEILLLRAVKSSSCRATNGVGRVLDQGVKAPEVWTEQAAPVASMRQALRNHLYA